MRPERSSLVFFAAAAVAVLWVVLVWPNLSFGLGRAADIAHGIIVAAIVFVGFSWAVRIEREDAAKRGDGHGGPH